METIHAVLGFHVEGSLLYQNCSLSANLLSQFIVIFKLPRYDGIFRSKLQKVSVSPQWIPVLHAYHGEFLHDLSL